MNRPLSTFNPLGLIKRAAAAIGDKIEYARAYHQADQALRDIGFTCRYIGHFDPGTFTHHYTLSHYTTPSEQVISVREYGLMVTARARRIIRDRKAERGEPAAAHPV